MLMSDVMTKDVPLLHPEDSLAESVAALRRTKLDALPVVGEDNSLIGIFTKANLMDAFLAGAGLLESIARYVQYNVVTIQVDTPFVEVEQRVKQSPVGTAIVVDRDGKVLGVFTKVDMIMALFKETEQLEETKRLYETLMTITNIAYEAIIVVNIKAEITLVNEAACGFFGKQEKELLHQPVDQVIENTRLPRTLKTGMAETNEIQVIHGRPYIVSRLPIIQGGKIIGAVGKIVYQKLEEVKEVAEQLAHMDQELKFYKERSEKERRAITFGQILTVNEQMRRLKQEAEIAARGSSTIMLTGESGTGKELFAEAIHMASPRRKGPFVKVNCAAVPDNLLESEFFGYAGGAFTGAQKGGKAGKFALAEGGTLLLDEIGDMSLNLQSKLLRVLEDKCFEPLGSNLTVRADLRIIAATNQDLLQKVESGEFRRDLFYRLNVIHFELTPLRERPEDILPLVYGFLERLNQDFNKAIQDVSPGVSKILFAHHWPGNVRELKNVIERAVNFATGEVLKVDDLPFYLREESLRDVLTLEKITDLASYRAGLDKEAIQKALSQVNGNRSEAARLLGISRSWLHEKMRRYSLK